VKMSGGEAEPVSSEFPENFPFRIKMGKISLAARARVEKLVRMTPSHTGIGKCEVV